MSSHSYTASCPVCYWDMDVCESNRPFPQIDCWCRVCWFATATEVYRESLEAINDNREEWWVEELITEEEYKRYDWHEYFKSLQDTKDE